MTEAQATIKHYYIDEAGDPTLFSAGGRILIGEKGCSRHFILGMLDVADPDALVQSLNELRSRLLADPYFRGVPSMQPNARKTVSAFHATDDVAEVRREAFSCLLKQKLEFYAVVRDKFKVLTYVRQKNEREPQYRYNPDELYDRTVSRLLRNKLHKADQYIVTFSKRGESNRTAALRDALHVAQQRFYEQYHRAKPTFQSMRSGPRHPPACRRWTTSYGRCRGYTSGEKTVM